MKIAKSELTSTLSSFNPWWHGEAISELPQWRRSIFNELLQWISTPPAPRAILLSGARQVGKTTLLLQAIDALIREQGVSAANILYVTFDHPIIKLAGIGAVIEAWREREPKVDGSEYLFLDEAQFIADWGTWVKHQTDFVKDRRIIFTGSAMPLLSSKQESGVGRWHTILLPTLSFYEYLQIRKIVLPQLPKLDTLSDLFIWSPSNFDNIAEKATPYVGQFHEYLVRGGFPQTALVDSITQAQRLIREDIIDKVLKRDMTALFGVRRVLELERTFLYLCMHDGGLLDIQELTKNLEVKKPTALHFIELLEATHLINSLRPFGYGKDVLRAKYKIYLADAAISSAVLLRGKNILNDATKLGEAVETTVFNHLCARNSQLHARFTYWKNKKNKEVDIIAELGDKIIPFEIKYHEQNIAASDVMGMQSLCREKSFPRAYIITKSLRDFGEMVVQSLDTKMIKIPAALFCYWLGESEAAQNDVL